MEPIGDLIQARRRELGLSQADVAEAVGVLDQPTVTRQEVARWERGKRIPRARARRALAHALDLPVRLLDLAAGVERSRRAGILPRLDLRPAERRLFAQGRAVAAIRAVLLDHSASIHSLGYDIEGPPPDLHELRVGLAEVMSAYQASRYADMLERLPEVLAGAHLAFDVYDGSRLQESQRVLALASQSAAMVLTKLGELDLAWTAADRGFSAAQDTGDDAVVGSLCRSLVHTLQSHGRTQAATRLAENSADDLRQHLAPTSERSASVYGTLLLAGAMASARAGDRHAALEQLGEAERYARRLGRDANHLWTAFGPTNVAIHRVATSVALGDMGSAYSQTTTIDPTRLPPERRVRYAFDVARLHAERGEVDNAAAAMLEAERLAPEQVHHHVMSRQIIAGIRRSPAGKRNDVLAQLARRVDDAGLASMSPTA